MNERLKTYIDKKLSKIDEELFIEQIDDELYQIFYSGVDGDTEIIKLKLSNNRFTIHKILYENSFKYYKKYYKLSEFVEELKELKIYDNLIFNKRKLNGGYLVDLIHNELTKEDYNKLLNMNEEKNQTPYITTGYSDYVGTTGYSDYVGNTGTNKDVNKYICLLDFNFIPLRGEFILSGKYESILEDIENSLNVSAGDKIRDILIRYEDLAYLHYNGYMKDEGDLPYLSIDYEDSVNIKVYKKSVEIEVFKRLEGVDIKNLYRIIEDIENEVLEK